MAHELTKRANGKIEMAYVGATPWHGLGEVLTAGATVVQWQKAAGMDWKVARSPAQFAVGGKTHTYNDCHVLYRGDTNAPLAVVGNDYKIVQPAEVLDFFAGLVKSAGYQMETAGTMFGGRRYWALARTGQAVTLPGKDVVGGFLLLATACDGSMATTAKFTTVRVVCNNTLQMSLSANRASAVKVRHNTNFSDTQVKIDLGLEQATWNQFCEDAKALASKPMTQQQAGRALAAAWGDVDKYDVALQAANDVIAAIKGSLPTPAIAQRVLALSASKDAIGGEMKSAKGTAWGVLNAATQYFDYEAKRTVDSRLESSWLGWGAARKVELAQALLAA